MQTVPGPHYFCSFSSSAINSLFWERLSMGVILLMSFHCKDGMQKMQRNHAAFVYFPYPRALPSSTCLAFFYSRMCHDHEFLFQQTAGSTLGLRSDLGASEPLRCSYPSQLWSKQGGGRDGWDEKSCCATSPGSVVWVRVSHMLRVVCVAWVLLRQLPLGWGGCHPHCVPKIKRRSSASGCWEIRSVVSVAVAHWSALSAFRKLALWASRGCREKWGGSLLGTWRSTVGSRGWAPGWSRPSSQHRCNFCLDIPWDHSLSAQGDASQWTRRSCAHVARGRSCLCIQQLKMLLDCLGPR